MENLLGALATQLDPEVVAPLILSWAGRFLAALAIFLAGRWVAQTLRRAVRRAVAAAEMDATVARLSSSLIYIVLMVFVVLTALTALGMNTTNFLVVLGVAGLAVGLALRDSLANVCAGVMLVMFRPFRVGDFIDAAGVSGSVRSIRLFSTVLKTPDNRVVTVPNALIHADTITNYSAEDTRRIDLVIGIGYGDDIARARALIQGVLSQDDRILHDPPPAMLLSQLGESSVDIAVRPWVKSADYWAVRSDLLERIKRALERAGLSIPYPQRDLHIVSGDAEGTA